MQVELYTIDPFGTQQPGCCREVDCQYSGYYRQVTLYLIVMADNNVYTILDVCM